VRGIVVDVAWGKVTSGVYKGCSIGGKVLARDSKDKKIITKIVLNGGAHRRLESRCRSGWR
jgi:hypothetical protein